MTIIINESRNHELKRRILDMVAKERTRSSAYRRMKVQVNKIIDEVVPHKNGEVRP
jgi:hypothetical protein